MWLLFRTCLLNPGIMKLTKHSGPKFLWVLALINWLPYFCGFHSLLEKPKWECTSFKRYILFLYRFSTVPYYTFSVIFIMYAHYKRVSWVNTNEWPMGQIHLEIYYSVFTNLNRSRAWTKDLTIYRDFFFAWNHLRHFSCTRFLCTISGPYLLFWVLKVGIALFSNENLQLASRGSWKHATSSVHSGYSSWVFFRSVETRSSPCSALFLRCFVCFCVLSVWIRLVVGKHFMAYLPKTPLFPAGNSSH